MAFLALEEGDHDLPQERAETALALQPNHAGALHARGLVAWIAGDTVEAVRYLEEALAASGSSPSQIMQDGRDRTFDVELALFVSTNLGYLYWQTGSERSAREIFRQRMEIARREVSKELPLGLSSRWRNSYDLARVHAVLGNKEDAYRWLEDAIEAGWRRYYITLSGPRDPMFDALRGEPRFERLMANVKAKLDSTRERVREMEPEVDALLRRARS